MKRPPTIIVQLVHLSGPKKGEIQEFADATIAIGRHPSCRVQFPADQTGISRRHADIVREGNQFQLVDHSTNGTFGNGKRVTETFLRSGDVLAFSELGPKVSFLTEMKDAPAELEPPAPPPPAARPRPAPEPRAPREAPARPPLRPPAAPPEERPRGYGGAAQGAPEPSVEKARVPLVVQYGPTLRSFRELPVVVGRHPGCALVIDHPGILDQHAQIFFSQNRYWIKDLTGAQCVRINRQPIAVQAPLNPSDEVALGPRGPVFRFLGDGRLAEISEPAAGEPARPAPGAQGRGQAPARRGDEEPGKKPSSFLKKFFKD